jgi:hypothetical protein
LFAYFAVDYQMGLKGYIAKLLAARVVRQEKQAHARAEQVQLALLQRLVKEAMNTAFGKEHVFRAIHSHQDFQHQVPVRDYEGLANYFNRVKSGESNVLWPGKPAYLAKTSGTTSGTKYIPITRASLPNHMNGAKNALLHYIHEKGNAGFLDGKLIFLSGSPALEKVKGIRTGRLSGIVNHHIPSYLRTNQLPGYATNCIEDWETKLAAIVKETASQRMTLISGIPPWVQMYFDRLTEKTGKLIGELFPDFNLLVYGGVNFEPYRAKLMASIGRKVDTIETFPASEGFFAYQDSQASQGLLLQLNSGIFYEFVPTSEFGSPNASRLTIGQVKVGVNYALVLSSNAGLWGYSIGDIVKFVSLNPYRVVVTGRLKHFISAFGEHVIAEEVERALTLAQAEFPEVSVVEFTVAPYVSPTKEEPSYHEWLIEFDQEPGNREAFSKSLNLHLRKLNSYYHDLQAGNILAPLRVTLLPKDSFRNYMKREGKLGGQNKVPRLSNDRKLAEALLQRFV